MQKLMLSIARNDNLSAYGEAQVMKELQDQNVELLLISEGLNDEKKNEFYYKAGGTAVKVEFISTMSSDGEQLFNLGGVAALLKRPSK